MKEDGEETLGNHDTSVVQPGSDSSSSSPESQWEEGQEVIPTFFSTMNTRYSVLPKIAGDRVPVSPLESQSWYSFQVMVSSN